MRRPVVAHITRASPEPTETFIHNQVANLQRYRPVAVCHHRGRGQFPIAPDLIAADTRSAPLRLMEAVGDRALRTPLPGTTLAMARFIEQQDATVLHYHFLVNARSYLAVKRRTNLPAVVSAYGYDVSLFPRRAGGAGRRYLAPIFSQIDRFLAMSGQMRRDLVDLGCPEDRIRVHYHGVDTARFALPGRRHANSQLLTILSCGRLIPTKGHAQLIEAAALVRRRCPVRFHVIVVGDGPLRGQLERSIERLELADVFELRGHVPHMGTELVAQYHEADVFALPAIHDRGQREGIPGTVVEAMAAGLPVVSTQHGGIPAVVTDGREGLLVREGDVRELADALERVLVDASLRRQLGTAAAARAGHELDVAPACRALEQIYDELRDGRQ